MLFQAVNDHDLPKFQAVLRKLGIDESWRGYERLMQIWDEMSQQRLIWTLGPALVLLAQAVCASSNFRRNRYRGLKHCFSSYLRWGPI